MSTPYEACRERKMSIHCEDDYKVTSAMAAIYGQLLPLCVSVEVVRVRNQPTSVTNPLESYSVVLTHVAPRALRLTIPLFQ